MKDGESSQKLPGICSRFEEPSYEFSSSNASDFCTESYPMLQPSGRHDARFVGKINWHLSSLSEKKISESTSPVFSCDDCD